MNLKNRETLKEFFSKGKMPAEGNFEALIDSMVNRIDDGFSKDMENGLMLSPEGSSKSLLGFFRSIEQKNAAWTIAIDAEDKHRGLCFLEPGQQGGVRMFLQEGGNVGIGTIAPAYKLDVNGLAGMKGRVGTFATGTIPADGEWHNVLADLNGCHAFEIVARVGQPGKGRYAILYATAASTFGRSKSKITKMQAHYGWWWNKMKIRWNGTTFSYGLQLRSRRNYGKDISIHYHITKLWGDEEMGFASTDKT
ncbi:MAG: adhesin [Bacteroidota bacterium]|nr:adhesin [Bacteroidota bacterium]